MTTKQIPHKWKKTLCLLLCGLGLVWASNAAAQDKSMPRLDYPHAGEKRVALVIGNGNYSIKPLRNPVNDARAMEKALQTLGFEVVRMENADQKEMKRAINAFGDMVRKAGVGLFFYSGHGVEYHGRNYMIPIDAVIAVPVDPLDVDAQAMDVKMVLGKMSAAQNRVNIVILDMCRDNPYGDDMKGGGQNFATMNAPAGTLIAFATGPESRASDAGGDNGLYTGALLKQMNRERVKLEDVFKATRSEVRKASGGKQVPWEHSSVEGDFYFMPAGGGGTLVAGGPGPSPKPKPAAGPKAGDIWTDTVTGMEFVWVPGGSFDMGSPDGETGRSSDEGPVHRVEVDGFWMGKTEVTVGQYMPFAQEIGQYPEWKEAGSKYNIKTGSEDIYKKFGSALTSENYPVVGVSWNNAKAYTQWLSGKNSKTFRLPSEAQWEYACRAGRTTARFWGNNPAEACKYANVDDGSHECSDGYKYTSPVGTFQPNPYGLYDMLGNVWEWVEDVFIADIYGRSDKKNPIYDSGGPFRVFRGGGWRNVPGGVRCAGRGYDGPSDRYSDVGFRLLRMP
jgi:formylglycine-generating enzyme required for sulfatase activity